MKTFTLKSNELGGQLTSKQYLNGMGYTGDNLSPQLSWRMLLMIRKPLP